MSQPKVILDASAASKLQGVLDGTALCDESGKTIGVVVSPEEYRNLLYARARADFNEEHARQAEEDYRAGRFVTTKEALDSLKSLHDHGSTSS